MTYQLDRIRMKHLDDLLYIKVYSKLTDEQTEWVSFDMVSDLMYIIENRMTSTFLRSDSGYMLLDYYYDEGMYKPILSLARVLKAVKRGSQFRTLTKLPAYLTKNAPHHMDIDSIKSRVSIEDIKPYIPQITGKNQTEAIYAATIALGLNCSKLPQHIVLDEDNLLYEHQQLARDIGVWFHKHSRNKHKLSEFQ